MSHSNHPGQVVVIEPQCIGFEHASYNAALIKTVSLAFPGTRIIAYAEDSHSTNIRHELARRNETIDIHFEAISIPRRKALNWARLFRDFTLVLKIIRNHPEAKAVLFCSSGNTSILALKLLIPLKKFFVPTAVVVHGCLSELIAGASRKPWNWVISLRRVLALPQPATMALIALGGSIYKHIEKLLPDRMSDWRILNLIYLPAPAAWGAPDSGIRSPIRFGYLGVAGKGFDSFCRIADEVGPVAKDVEFVMVGFQPEGSRSRVSSRYVGEVPSAPLPRPDFEKRVEQITYFIWTASPEKYQLTASATFLDALAFSKPGIYLRNPYIEHYFNCMGDIGYLCTDMEEVAATIRSIADAFPSERYQQQVENIEKGRAIFTPERLAPELRAILTSCATGVAKDTNARNAPPESPGK